MWRGGICEMVADKLRSMLMSLEITLGQVKQSEHRGKSSWSIEESAHVGIPDCATYFIMLT